MEKDLAESVKESLSHPRTVGHLCADQNGLCLAVSGTANEKSSGFISIIGQLANKLEPGKSPSVHIESDRCKILVHCKDSITTALYKGN